ncbi:hypothetical protein CH330_00435 [candidate division WOR-3 bacterium JGI_Cruoil_03_51_56]|uniref:Uncharacterized protein n=2 Tax=candidate division WOR-3 bacterium JGI_Cruoil_03_51_56 TaxID=1973747 RepID=A0A235BZY2_UNCW3|nr:MAG: hypothetical protein CH330_00435 [candidate division WOR-3 bacterium JGI_Cruoil_03_51_56]
MSADPWTWIAAILTLAIFSFLYKENPFYRFAEHLFVGVANGYAITFYWHRVLVPSLINPVSHGQKLWLIAIAIIGALYFTRFIPKVSWLVRIPIAVVLGYFSGAYIPRAIDAQILQQLRATIVTRSMFANWQSGLWAVIIALGVIATITYFFFSAKRKGILKPVSRIGIIFIMVGFGASFGYTVMARISLLIGRLQFLLGDWLGLIH